MCASFGDIKKYGTISDILLNYFFLYIIPIFIAFETFKNVSSFTVFIRFFRKKHIHIQGVLYYKGCAFYLGPAILKLPHPRGLLQKSAFFKIIMKNSFKDKILDSFF